MAHSLTAAILVVSTTAAQDPSTDATTSILRDVLDQDGGGQWKVTDTSIVTDDATDVQRQIIAWTDRPEPVSLIITTGGTGFAVSDSTPEVRMVSKSAECHLLIFNPGCFFDSSQASSRPSSCHAVNISRRDALYVPSPRLAPAALC